MAINLNQLNTSPLASLAGNTVHSLGLQPYGIDAGAINKGIAQGQIQVMQAQAASAIAAEKNHVDLTIQMLKNQGLLDKSAADNASKEAQVKYQQQMANLRQASINEINQQNADSNKLNAYTNVQKAQDLASYQQGTLANQQQQINNTAQYQQGMLSNEKQKAQNDVMKTQLEYALKLDDKKAAMLGQFGAAASTIISQVKDPSQQKTMLNDLMNQADEQGFDTSKFRKMNPQELSVAAANAMMLSHVSTQAKEKASSMGMQFTTDENGNVVAKPLETKGSELDKKLADTMATQAGNLGTDRATFGRFKASTDIALQQLAGMSEKHFGPIAGWIGSLTREDSQNLDSTLKAMALQAKDIFKLGSGQGFTDTDREFLVSITGGLKNYKGSLQDIITKMQHFAVSAQNDAWLREYNIMKQSQFGQQWIKDNPAPTLTIQEHDSKGAPIGKPLGIKGTDWAEHITEYTNNNWKLI